MAWVKGSRTYNDGAWVRLRKYVLARDNGQCVKCGNIANQVDHIVSVKEGGSDHPTNLQLLCIPHHKEKTLLESARARNRVPSRVRDDHKYVPRAH